MAPTVCLQDLVGSKPLSGVQEICACYFETHISPMIKTLQYSQELMNERLEDKCMSMQKAADALGAEQRLLVSKSVSTLKRMQELTVKVNEKADATDIARLSALVVSSRQSCKSVNAPQVSSPVSSPSQMLRFEESLHSSLQECMARFDKLDAALAKKADSEHVATLGQLQEMKLELSAAAAVMAEDKVEGSTAWSNMGRNKEEAKMEQVDPTGQGASKPCLSGTLRRRKLTSDETDNKCLMLGTDLEELPFDRQSTCLSGECSEDYCTPQSSPSKRRTQEGHPGHCDTPRSRAPRTVSLIEAAEAQPQQRRGSK